MAQHKPVEKLNVTSLAAYTAVGFLSCKTELPHLQFLQS